MKVYSTRDVKRMDSYTIEHEPISSIDLMERAALLVAQEIMTQWHTGVRVVVFAGWGNNGGDGLAVARLLSQAGYRGRVYLFNPFSKLSPDTLHNRQRLAEARNFSFVEVVNEFIPPPLDNNTLVIDALFGAGLNAPLSGGFTSLVDYINQSAASVVSIDVPSGLMGEDNSDSNYRYVVQATLTLTFQFPKLAFFFAENEYCVGAWKALDIAIHPDILTEIATPYYYTQEADIKALLHPLSRFASKHLLGHVLLYAGSIGMIGAAVLAAKAVMQTGAGLLTVHLPRCGYTIMQSVVPEAMVQLDTNERYITEMPLNHRYEAIAVGQGLGRKAETAEALYRLLLQLSRPAVIDADALNILSDHIEWLAYLPKHTIITPHTKEFDRLFGNHTNSYQRLCKAREMAKRYQLVIVLKGAHTAIVDPTGDVHINSTGNAGMATAGSGDVLAGIIASLLAQGYLPKEAARIGVYLHGLAGDIAAREHSPQAVTAGRIVEAIGKAYLYLNK